MRYAHTPRPSALLAPAVLNTRRLRKCHLLNVFKEQCASTVSHALKVSEHLVNGLTHIISYINESILFDLPFDKNMMPFKNMI